MTAKEFSFIATLSPEDRQMLVQDVVNALLPLLNSQNAHTGNEEPEQPISKVEACRLLRCSQPTMTKWMAAGKIPFYRKGRRVYFFRSEVLNSLEQPLRRGA